MGSGSFDDAAGAARERAAALAHEVTALRTALTDERRQLEALTARWDALMASLRPRSSGEWLLVGVACGFLMLPLLAIIAAILWLSTDGVRGG